MKAKFSNLAWFMKIEYGIHCISRWNKRWSPRVIELVRKAPTIDKWEINAFSQRVTGYDLSIKFSDGVKVDYKDVYFQHGNEE